MQIQLLQLEFRRSHYPRFKVQDQMHRNKTLLNLKRTCSQNILNIDKYLQYPKISGTLDCLGYELALDAGGQTGIIAPVACLAKGYQAWELRHAIDNVAG